MKRLYIVDDKDIKHQEGKLLFHQKYLSLLVVVANEHGKDKKWLIEKATKDLQDFLDESIVEIE